MRKNNKIKIAHIKLASPRELVIVWEDTSETILASALLATISSEHGVQATAKSHPYASITQATRRGLMRDVRLVDGESVVISWAVDEERSVVSIEDVQALVSLRSRTHSRKVSWTQPSFSPTRFSYQHALTDVENQRELLEQLSSTGLVVVEGVPPEPSKTKEIASLVGIIKQTSFGVYDMINDPTSKLVGRSGISLDLHSDEPYRIQPPDFVFFQMVEASNQGGETLLADAYAAAQELRSAASDMYQTLARVPVMFDGPCTNDRKLCATHTIIEHDCFGDVSSVFWRDRNMQPVESDVAKVEEFFKSASRFNHILERSAHKLRITLRSNELLIFDNRRILHGRTSFPSSQKRHLRIFHVDRDEMVAKLTRLKLETFAESKSRAKT